MIGDVVYPTERFCSEEYTLEQELEDSKSKTLKLELQINKKNKLISELQKDNAELKDRISISEAGVRPLRESLNKITSEHGKLLRKYKRLKNKL